MSKFTTTINEIIQSELRRCGFNEFFNDNRLTFFDDNYRFMKKIIRFDDDVYDIVHRMFFQYYTIGTTDNTDRLFKYMFVTKFQNREINRQTVEDFSSQLLYYVLTHEHYIQYVFEELDNYLTGKTTSHSDSKENQTSFDEYRQLVATLPQSKVNLNVDDDDLDYADNNTISKDKKQSDQNGETQNQSNSYDLNVLQGIYSMIDKIFMDIDKKCFLQIW